MSFLIHCHIKTIRKCLKKTPLQPFSSLLSWVLAWEPKIMNTETLTIFKKQLNHQLQSLLREASGTVEGMSDEEKKETFPDPTDRAALETDRNFLLRIRDRERKLITKIRESLKRIEEGEFGICASCGGDISAGRLEARPVTTLCIQCKTDAEENEHPVQ